jgi:hypothetical protein
MVGTQPLEVLYWKKKVSPATGHSLCQRCPEPVTGNLLEASTIALEGAPLVAGTDEGGITVC